MNRQNMNRQDMTIGILSITAAILVATWILAPQEPSPALAAGMSVGGGDYSMTVGQINQAEEVVFIVNNAVNRMIVYYIDPRTQSIQVADAEDLSGLAGAGGAVAPQQPGQGGPKNPRQPVQPKTPSGPPKGRGAQPTP